MCNRGVRKRKGCKQKKILNLNKSELCLPTTERLEPNIKSVQWKHQAHYIKLLETIAGENTGRMRRHMNY